MLVLLILSIIVGMVVAGISGAAVLGCAAGGFFFLLGLPGALIGSWIHGEVSYTQDRADWRQIQSDFEAEDREDARMERLYGHPTTVIQDRRNQHIHIHGGS